MIGPLREGAIDAVFLIDWNHGDFIAEGLEMRRLPSRALDRIRLSSCLWTSENYLRASPRRDCRHRTGMAKVTTYALENPEAAVRLMWHQEPQTRRRPENARIEAGPRNHESQARMHLLPIPARRLALGRDRAERDRGLGRIS